MRLALALIGLVGLFAVLHGAAGPARADTPPQSDEPTVERWSADPRLWLALIEWRQRLRLELASSRELCTAGTLTEISWQIAGGKPPYKLQVEGTLINTDADNLRINCGALSEAEAADEAAALAAKRVTAVVTDARGVRREAAIEVARARALPAPEPRGTAVQRTRMATDWVTIGGAHHEADVGWWLMRWRPLAESDSGWTYVLVEKRRVGNIEIAGFDGLSEGSSYAYAVATLRAPIEQETPDALVWSSESEATTSTTPTGVRATSTHDTIIVSWDDQPSVNYVAVDLIRADGVGRSRRVIMRRHNAVVTNQVTHTDLEPETEYEIDVSVHGDGEAQLLTTIRATTVAAPTDWQPPARGAQNLSVTATHDTITATWDAPIPNTRDRWIVYVEHSSWHRPYSRWVSAPLTFTLEGLTPETTYTVAVAHLDLYGVEVSTTVTTTPTPVQGQSSPGYPADPRLWLALIEWRQRLRLQLASSRELCTAGTLTEVSWQIAGGAPPYSLQVEGVPVDVDADNVRINCGALSEAEAADGDAALAAKRITAVVTDARGVRREAALDVARARALPAPTNVRYSSNHRTVLALWDEVAGAGSQSPRSIHPVTRSALRTTAMVRTRAKGDAIWRYKVVDREGHNELGLDALPGTHEFSVAVVRHPLEVETPAALNWSDALAYTATKPAPNMTLTATHDTVTVSWDRQPLARHPGWNVELLDVEGGGMRSDIMSHRMISDQGSSSARHTVTFTHLPPDTAFNVHVYLNLAEHEPIPSWMASLSSEHPRTVRTKPAPPDWTPWPVGAQNLQTTATGDSITISWDAPSDSAADRWFVELHDSASGRLLYARWVYLSESPLTINRLLPTTTYRITVEHIDLQTTTTTATVTTSAAASANGPLTLERRTASSLTISWSWSGQTASAYEIAWRARSDDDPATWRSLRKTAAQRRHTIDGLEERVQYVVRVRPLDSNDRPLATLQGSFATSSAAAEAQSLDPRLLRGLAERLTLEIFSSRELCTAGTLTEVSWEISGGKPPYVLQVEGTSVNTDADNIRINCGALTEAEAVDEDAALAAKRITATVTDSRGVRREAALDVARARALPAPTGITAGGHRTLGGAYWSSPPTASPDLQPVNYMVRWRTVGSSTWVYDAESVRGLPDMRWDWGISDLSEGTQYELAIAALRDQIEQANPEALQWSADMPFATAAPPQNVVAVSTHNTITVTWDAQPGDRVYSLYASGPHGGKGPSRRSANADTHQAVFVGLSPDTEFTIQISVVMTEGQETGTSTVARTKPAPPNWQPLPSKPKNLRTTATHNSITAEWNAPHDQADGWYLVSLFDAATGQKIGRPVTIDRTSVIFLDLLPSTRYEVEIIHLGIVHGRVTRVVTTSASAGSDGAAGEPRPLPGFLPAQE